MSERVDYYDDPWSWIVLSSPFNYWTVIIEPGPPCETQKDEFIRAYQMAYFFEQLHRGDPVLKPTQAAISQRDTGGWRSWRSPDE